MLHDPFCPSTSVVTLLNIDGQCDGDGVGVGMGKQTLRVYSHRACAFASAASLAQCYIKLTFTPERVCASARRAHMVHTYSAIHKAVKPRTLHSVQGSVPARGQYSPFMAMGDFKE